MTVDGEGSKVLVAPTEAGGMPRVRSGSHSGLASDTLLETVLHGAGRPGGETPPPPP